MRLVEGLYFIFPSFFFPLFEKTKSKREGRETGLTDFRGHKSGHGMQAAGAACGGEGRGGSKVGRGGGKIRLPAHERKAFRASTEVGFMFLQQIWSNIRSMPARDRPRTHCCAKSHASLFAHTCAHTFRPSRCRRVFARARVRPRMFSALTRCCYRDKPPRQ